jgi:hypothetical protein
VPFTVRSSERVLFMSTLFFIVLFAAAPLCGGQDAFVPRAGTGRNWEVKAQYRSIGNNQGWLAPIRFLYSISAAGENGQHIQVTDQSGDLIGTIRFEEGFSLLEVDTLKQVRGKRVRRALSFNRAGPVKTTESPFPFDWPVFPLYPERTRDFPTLIRLDDGLTARRFIRQKVEAVTARDLPELVKRKETQGPVLKVTCVDSSGGLIFIQYWAEGLPWPVYGENSDMRYWLVSR